MSTTRLYLTEFGRAVAWIVGMVALVVLAALVMP